MQFFRKLRQKGLLGGAEAVIRRIEAPFGRLQRRLAALSLLKQANYTAVFIHEGGTGIVLPHGSSLLGGVGLDGALLTSADFLQSALSEVLLRHTIFSLYSNGHIDPAKSIIDIGCWCGDNTLAWARCLNDPGVVYAVDPSAKNLAYARALALENSISNVRWVQAVCADVPGLSLGFTGPIEHARFHDAAQGTAAQMMSSTLDEIVAPEDRASIGLMHVDVEGLEERVLQGAAGIIEASRPVIAFEQHLCEDNTQAIVDLLATRGYRVFMVNEIIPHCRSDCRNFIAFPADFPVPADMTNPPIVPRAYSHVPAVVGSDLIPYTPTDRVAKPTAPDADAAKHALSQS